MIDPDVELETCIACFDAVLPEYLLRSVEGESWHEDCAQPRCDRCQGSGMAYDIDYPCGTCRGSGVLRRAVAR